MHDVLLGLTSICVLPETDVHFAFRCRLVPVSSTSLSTADQCMDHSQSAVSRTSLSIACQMFCRPRGNRGITFAGVSAHTQPFTSYARTRCTIFSRIYQGMLGMLRDARLRQRLSNNGQSNRRLGIRCDVCQGGSPESGVCAPRQ